MFKWLEKLLGGADRGDPDCIDSEGTEVYEGCQDCACGDEECALGEEEFETTDDPGTRPPTNYVVVLPHITYGMAVAGPEEDVWAYMVEEEGGYLHFYSLSKNGCYVPAATFAPGSWRNWFIAGDDENSDFSMLRKRQKDMLRKMEIEAENNSRG